MKISKESMMKDIQEELLLYFKNGIISPIPFFKIDNRNIFGMEEILKIHFMLDQGVQDFILSLPENMRKFKNSSYREEGHFIGQLKGEINWQATMKNRHNRSQNKNNFVCKEVNKLYMTKENIVLKGIIEILYNIIFVSPSMKKYNGKDWYKRGLEIEEIVMNMNRKNIYLRKLDISKINISDRDLVDVSKSGNELYRRAAEVFIYYRKVMAREEDEMKKLLTNTFIEISEADRVFELYSIFNYLRLLQPQNMKYNLINPDINMIGHWYDSENIYEIYHNSIGLESINFRVDRSEVEGIKNPFVERKLRVLERKNEIYNQLRSGNIARTLWQGRPDLVIYIKDRYTESLKEIIVGEIKYTKNFNYMLDGLEELLEYMYFCKDGLETYIYEESKSIGIRGLLFVEDIDLEKYSFKDIELYNLRRMRKYYK